MPIKTWRRDKAPTGAELAGEWAARGFTCGLWIDPPGRSWLDFVHDTEELVLVESGRVRLVIEGESVELAPGDGALIPAGATHSVFNIGGTEARWYYGYSRRKT